MNQMQQQWRKMDRDLPKLTDDTYTVEGLSHLFGIPRDIILHEITTGELRTRQPYHTSGCIDRADIHDWLIRRGPGI